MQQIPLYDQVVAERFYAVGDWSATGRRLSYDGFPWSAKGFCGF